ncbi:protein SERAC1 isoform X2 [Harmonia axyridis]|uniref:protein SERAC1 isoform X2 n=1 Tax=Harmonia axyridis TaxID=115357 RepID=UPI001E274F3A|nr:protein SERAC1 isoform X2 [Harmonia axyridis]
MKLSNIRGRLNLAVAIVTRAVLPTVFNIYYSILRNQQILVDNLCNQVLPSILAFIVNTISSSISTSRQEITFVTQEEIEEGHNEISIETNEQGAERSVELSILYKPEGESEADVIFIHGLHGGLGRTWTQGQWRHDNHKLKDQLPTTAPTGEMFVPPKKQSLTETILSIYNARAAEYRKRSKDEDYIESREEWNFSEMEEEQCQENLSDCWPRDWIKLDCPNVRVMALNYDTDVLWCPIWMKQRKRTGMVERSDEMIEELLRVGVGKKPIIWVGHSKGGLYIKQIILNAVERNPLGRVDILNIKTQTKAIMFYSVPHKGSILADVSLPFLRKSVELVEVQRNCDFILDLDKKFLTLYQSGEFSPEIFSFIETAFTLMSFVFLKIIAFDSANLGIGVICKVPLDHREICKPAGRDCFLYKELIKLIKKVQNNNID